jgi:hypothetical protein
MGSLVTTVPRPLRRVVIFGGPLLAYLIGVAHPDHLAVGESDRLFIAIHVAFPFAICLLAWGLWLLVDGVANAAATVARVLVVPFAVAYTAFEAVAGIARGTLVWKANELSGARQLHAAELISSWTHSGIARPLYVTASALWLAAALAVVAALRRRAPAPALVLMAAGAALFAFTHVRPWGPGGMAAFLAGVIWVELDAARDRASEPGTDAPREPVDAPR